MAIDLDARDGQGLPELRFQRVVPRVRAPARGGVTVADTTRAVLVWEPRRVVPSYAVPEADLRADLLAGAAGPADDGRPVLDPRVPFGVHTAPARRCSVRLPDGTRSTARRTGSRTRRRAGGPRLRAFDWRDEDEPRVSHPRDPRHRIDVCRSGRRVRIEHEGRLLAESDRAPVAVRGHVPVRALLPARARTSRCRWCATTRW